MLCNANLKKKKKNSSSNIHIMFNRLIEIMEVATVLSYLFLNLEKGENDENDDSNIEIWLNFEAAIAAE